MLVQKLVEDLGVEAAIITQEGFGNPTTDLMMACKNIEDSGNKDSHHYKRRCRN